MGSIYHAYASTVVPSFATRRALSLNRRISCLYQSQSGMETLAPDSDSDSFGAKKQLRSTHLVAKEYADLNLTDKIYGEMGPVRIRQHVNPLSSSFSIPAPIPDWNQVYKDPTLPLMVDIGSGSGRFLLYLAKKNVVFGNYLGLEIRKKLVNRAEFWVKELGLSNTHFIFANATVSFQQLVSTYPGPLMLVSILCPDPHFKTKHQKRRVLQKPLVDSIINNLQPKGKVYTTRGVRPGQLPYKSKRGMF